MKINVSDGFVELVDHMGDDLAIVNAARVLQSKMFRIKEAIFNLGIAC